MYSPSRSFLTTVLMLGAGCSTPLSPTAADLRLDLEVASATLSAGDTIDVTLTLRNPGWQAVELTGMSSCPPWGIQVFDDDGEVVADGSSPIGRICTADSRTWSIGARDSNVESLRLTTMIAHGDEQEPLPPGQYRLVGVVRMGPDVAARSAPVLLEVMEE